MESDTIDNQCLSMFNMLQEDGKKEFSSGPKKILLEVCIESVKTVATLAFDPLPLAEYAVDKAHELLGQAGLGVAERVGDCVVDLAKLDKLKGGTVNERAKNDRSLLFDIGKGFFLLVLTGAALHPITAIAAAGIIIVSAGFKWLLKHEQISKKERWQEIVASMMSKYRTILEDRSKQARAKRAFDKGIEQKRLSDEFKNEQKDEKAKVAKVKGYDITAGDLVRFRIYTLYVLGWRIPEGDKCPRQDLAEASLLVKIQVDAWYDNNVAFEEMHGPGELGQQLYDIQESLYGALANADDKSES